MSGSTELGRGVDGLGGLIEEGEAFHQVRTAAASKGARTARRFHTGIAAAAIVTTFAGFAPTYFLRGLSTRPPLSGLLQVHGMVFTAWLVLLFTQTALVASHRIVWHRRLGMAGALLAAMMVPLGIMAGINSARRGSMPDGLDPLVFLIFPVGQILMFGAAVGAAIWKRRKPEIHRRLILLSTAIVVTPAISRLPFVPNPMVSTILSGLFVVAGMVHDRMSGRRMHPIYIWGGIALMASGPLRFALAQTGAWHAIARFLVN